MYEKKIDRGTLTGKIEKITSLKIRAVQIYGSRIVPGKKYILSGGRHLIYLAAATYYVAAAT